MMKTQKYVCTTLRIHMVRFDSKSKKADQLEKDLKGLGLNRTYDENRWLEARKDWKKA